MLWIVAGRMKQRRDLKRYGTYSRLQPLQWPTQNCYSNPRVTDEEFRP
jgi:hypothetical protein